MKKYTTIIIDDEPKLQKVLQLKLEKYCPQIQVLGCANNAKEGYALITQKKTGYSFFGHFYARRNRFRLVRLF